MFRGGGYPSDDEDGWIDSVESLKAASASLTLHESASASLLLPCGLLPEELAELEGSVAPALAVDAAGAAVKTAGALSVSLATEALDSPPPGPHTPLGTGEALAFSETSDEDEGPAIDADASPAGSPARKAAAS